MFEVRIAKPEDAESILKITKQAFAKYIELAGIQDTAALHEDVSTILEDIKTKLVFVAYLDGVVVGSVRLKLLDDGETAYLSRFGVSHEYQNLGIGKAIMNAMDIEMKAKKIKRVELHTASRAFSLVRFYYGRGFYIDSTTKDMGYVRAKMIKEY